MMNMRIGKTIERRQLMARFYFTYGSEGYPFVGGWTEVEAEDRHKACAAFRTYHPDKTEGLLNCSDVYTQEEFMQSGMAEDNLGARCHEYISLKQTEKEFSYFEVLKERLLMDCQMVNDCAAEGDLPRNNVNYGCAINLARVIKDIGHTVDIPFVGDGDFARIHYVVIDGQRIDLVRGDEQ